jgi:hypothetical protein
MVVTLREITDDNRAAVLALATTGRPGSTGDLDPAGEVIVSLPLGHRPSGGAG